MVCRTRVNVEGISPDEPLRVLYIGGCGRSGTTVLDMMLGNHPAMQSVGEACHVAGNAWLRDEYCACGQLGRDCPFWKEVLRRWTERVGQVDLPVYIRQSRQIESRLRIGVTRRGMAACDPEYLQYARLTVGLLAAIRDVSGCEIVVDSSKAPSRPLALSMVEGVDLRLVHMIRDCRGVLWSGKKRFQKDSRAGISKDDGGKSILRTMKTWTVANLLAESLRHSLPQENSIRLRYEDLLAQPDIELRRIGSLVGMEMESLVAAITAGKSLAIGHTIAGNRMRMSGSVQLRPDVEWVEKLTWRDQMLCWVLVGWLMKAYGYRWRSMPLESSVKRQAA